MNIVAIRLLSQQLAAPQFSDPAQVVAHMGAMQAQEYRMMRWAVSMRTKSPSLSAFRKAYESKRIVRLHLMRGTWQLIAGEDYRWMLDLCAPRAMAIIKGWMSSNRITISDEELYRIREILEQTAAEEGSVTKEGFADALVQRDIHMDDHRLSYHIRMAELAGVLCNGDLQKMKATYQLVPDAIKCTGSSMDRDEALMKLARKYFQSHGPATLEDFVWWSGMNTGDCRKAIDALSHELRWEEWNGLRFYLTESCRVRGFKKGQTLLLPSYDEYLIGYKSRDVALPIEYRHRAHSNNGIFYPVVAQDGIVCGNWTPFKDDPQVEYFDARESSTELLDEWAVYRKFLLA